MTRLTGAQIAAEKLDGWTFVLGALTTRIATADFARGLEVVQAIGAVATEMDHHPDLDLRYAHLDVRLTSHDVHGVTDRDVRLARRISDLPDVRPDSTTITRLEFALDSPAFRTVQPFWAAVLAMTAADNDLTDPHAALPSIWFQESGADEPRQHWHPDVWLDPTQVQPRIDAALAAGGTLVSDAEAPSFWVLADPEGNKVCLCTWQDRQVS